MRKCTMLLAISLVLLAGCACSRDLVPDGVLEGLHKPVINKINPAAVQFNGAGFYLDVWLSAEDAQYVLYINDRKVGQSRPGYWRNSVGYMISKELLDELLGASADGATLNVRVTGISENYDISGDFDRYRDYVSEPVPLEIRRGRTAFSAAKRLFPEWTHSSEPLVRCDSQGNIYLSWLEALNDVNQAFFSFSADNGETWSQVLNISRSSVPVYQVDLATDGAGHFYMTWMTYRSQGSDVFFSRSLDNGATWHLPIRVNPSDTKAENPALAVDDRGGVLLAWQQVNSPGDWGFRLAVSHDLGATWNTRNFIAPDAEAHWPPLLATRAGGLAYLVNSRFKSNRLYFAVNTSRDYGATWKAQESSVDASGTYMFVEYPLLRIGDGGQFYFVWGGFSGAGHSVSLWNEFLRRESSGEWSSILNLRMLCPASTSRVALAASGSRVDAVLDGSGCLYLLRSTDEGRGWSLIETVPGSDGPYVTHSPDTASHPSGKTCLVFIRNTEGTDRCLYLTRFD